VAKPIYGKPNSYIFFLLPILKYRLQSHKMAKLKIQPKDLQALGYPRNAAISVAMSVMEQYYKHDTLATVLDILKNVLATPEKYWNDPVLSKIAVKIKPITIDTKPEKVVLRDAARRFEVFGQDFIDEAAFRQMKTAMRLPIAEYGALMPDAHSGYGLPIGGVLATENAVIPYGVGVDIGCRMALSILPMKPADLTRRHYELEQALRKQTLFGSGGAWKQPLDHEVLDSSLFLEIPILKNMEGKAARQLGTSGTGNHFVEWGIVAITQADNDLNLPCGEYVGLLSHSGSRGMGATIANHYTKVAKQKRPINGEAANLAWLNLSEQEGMEYWLAMNLAGDYAKACHDTIHKNVLRALGEKPLAMIENHHNFAWKEQIDGREMVVHRKGATPAKKGEWGIIPGSMATRGFIVQGKGETASLQSAAHGAGRKMSRSLAKSNVSHSELKRVLAQNEVTLIGGGLDESPHAYKDIEMVMKAQKSLVEVVGTFQPRIVRMAEGD
jgi:tRNA-splicing ligase RtcB (3'-phosphate/5'-hydroxy nucleic acid ligase)